MWSLYHVIFGRIQHCDSFLSWKDDRCNCFLWFRFRYRQQYQWNQSLWDLPGWLVDHFQDLRQSAFVMYPVKIDLKTSKSEVWTTFLCRHLILLLLLNLIICHWSLDSPSIFYLLEQFWILLLLILLNISFLHILRVY